MTLSLGTLGSVAALNALSLIASALPKLNPPTPIYAIIQSDTFIPMTIPTSWGEFSERYEAQMSDYPQERGAFQPYNKVKRPRTVTVTLVKEGSDLARFAWLQAIRQLESDAPTQLYTLISPTGLYPNFAIQGMSHETRPDRGSNILYLNIVFYEVPTISTGGGLFSDVKDAVGSAVSNVGTLFSNPLGAAQSALANAQTFVTGAASSATKIASAIVD